METPVKVERYGKMVMETSSMDKLRRDTCMCLHCGKMKPGEDDHCKVAKSFFDICKANGNAFIMTRCMHWESK
jgi:hypothetical protein